MQPMSFKEEIEELLKPFEFKAENSQFNLDILEKYKSTAHKQEDLILIKGINLYTDETVFEWVVPKSELTLKLPIEYTPPEKEYESYLNK